MDRRILIIIGAAVVLILLFLFIFTGGFGLFSSSEMDETNTSGYDNKLKLAQLYLDQGEYERALNYIDELLLENSDSTELIELQREVIRRKNAEDHESLAEQRRLQEEALQRDNSNISSLLEEMEDRYSSTSSKMQLEEIASNASQEERDRINSINELLLKGEEQMRNQQYEQARDTFEDVLKLDPDSGKAYAYIGESHYMEDPDDKENIESAI